MHRNRVRSVLGAAAVSLLVAACGSSNDDNDASASGGDGPCAGDGTASEVYAELADLEYEERVDALAEGAAQEGLVTLYSSRDADLLEELKQGFEELYPDVTLEYLSGENPELFARMQQEGTGANAAVDLVVADLLPAMEAEGMLADIHGVPITPDFPEEGYGENYIMFGPSPSVIAWNTDLVSEDEAPKTWEDLLDPKWKGKIAIEAKPDHMTTEFVLAWGEEKAHEYMTELMKNEPLIRKGHSTINELLAAGEFPVAAEVYLHKTMETIEDGAPVDWALPDPAPNGSNAFGIAEQAPNPCGAALFANFLVREEGAKIWAADARLVLTPGVEAKYPEAGEVVGDPRIRIVDPFTREEAHKVGAAFVDEFITPAFTG